MMMLYDGYDDDGDEDDDVLALLNSIKAIEFEQPPWRIWRVYRGGPGLDSWQ